MTAPDQRTLEHLTFILSVPPNATVAFVGRTIRDLVHDVIQPIRAACPEAVSHSQGTTAHICGRRVHLIATADPQVETRIRGVTLSAVYRDELLPPKLADLLAYRTRSAP